MAGVTNAPFRALCRRYGPGLVYVNEMVMATAVVHGNAKTERMITFGPDERPRSLQLYGSDPGMLGRRRAHAVRAGQRRPHRPQLRLPGSEGDTQGRRGGGAGQAGPAARDPARCGRGGAAVRRAGDRQVPHGSVRRPC